MVKAHNKRFTNRVTRSVLEIRSPHFYARPSQARAVQKRLGFVFPSTDRVTRLVNRYYCLTACLYAKCCNLIGWIIERGPSIHFRIDGLDHLYGFRSKSKHRIFGKMVEKLSTEVVKS